MAFVAATLTAGLVVVCAPAAAHDYWIDRDARGYTLFQGHVHSSHKGEDRVPYDPAIVKGILCARATTEVIAVMPMRAYPVRAEARCDAVLVHTNTGYWTQTLTDTVNKPKSEVRGALRGWLAEETVKRVDAWTPAAARPVSDALELTPLENPFSLKPGDKLRVVATWRGQPKRGVAVAYDGDARGVTGTDGQINIRIRRMGVQMLSASWDEAGGDANADKIVRGTILQFELAR